MNKEAMRKELEDAFVAGFASKGRPLSENLPAYITTRLDVITTKINWDGNNRCLRKQNGGEQCAELCEGCFQLYKHEQPLDDGQEGKGQRIDPKELMKTAVNDFNLYEHEKEVDNNTMDAWLQTKEANQIAFLIGRAALPVADGDKNKNDNNDKEIQKEASSD